MATPLLSLRRASAGYGSNTILHDIDLTIRSGERVAVLGRSGAGKSTLLSLIYGQLAAEAALVPQGLALVRTLSVFHNVYMGRLDRHPTWRNLLTLAWPSRSDREEVRGVLAQVGMAEFLFAAAGALSGGQQQRVCVARALYNGRRVLIGDEPVSALDRIQGGDVLDRLRERHETLVLAMHDVELACSRCDRIVVLQAGRIALDSPVCETDEGTLRAFYEPAP